MADHIGEILDCPITIEDSNHRIIAYSEHEENVDAARIATIIRRKVPENVINSLWKSGVMTKLFESDEPVIIPAIENVGLGNRIAVSVRKNNEVLGFIWAQTNDKKITEDKLQMLKEAAKQVKNQLLQHQIKKRKAEENYKEFFWKLLAGHVPKLNEIKRQADKFGINLDGKLSVAIIEFDHEVSPKIEKHAYYLIETLQQVHVVCRVFDQNQLILLIRHGSNNASINSLKCFLENFIEKIKERLKIEQVKGSCGLIYDSPQMINKSYQEALRVLELKEEFSHELKLIYSYQELGIYQFLEELFNIRNKEKYQNYSIGKLREYDRKHQSNLLPTLKTYLECDNNVQDAAKVLHVHTNTLNYRLKRIAEIAEIDLKDVNQKITLYLDLKIEEMKSDNS
ncbi:PucR family transcriptional regulator [Heyndrickxia sp. NPDC080065]|uniref:PucR family transcriptional regulator n=1 Tax=Heyndrickxia sp. NPDC080065 TaxID=3390568 RepID=UPI003CFE8065